MQPWILELLAFSIASKASLWDVHTLTKRNYDMPRKGCDESDIDE
jgi:hypothetical protein